MSIGFGPARRWKSDIGRLAIDVADVLSMTAALSKSSSIVWCVRHGNPFEPNLSGHSQRLQDGVITRLVQNRTFRSNERGTRSYADLKRCRHTRSPKACDSALEVLARKSLPKPTLRWAPLACLFHGPYALALR